MSVPSRRVTGAVLLGAALFALVACGSSDDSMGNGATSSAAASSTSPPPSPAVTEYADATDEVRALSPGIRDTDVARLADRLAAAFPEQEGRTVTVQSLERGEPSVAVIAVRGAGDDSVAGADYRVTFEDDEGGWVIASAEKRYACLRGVAEGVCV
jgi:hypothetical protein